MDRRREIPWRATVRALLLAMALAWYMSLDRPFAAGANSNAPRTTNSRSRARASPYVRLQLARPEQHEQDLSVSELAACFFNCQTATPAFPTCCSFLGVGICVNTQIDPNNCGKCRERCALGTFCCAGNCTNILSDVNNCGFCGNRCPQPGACTFGFCNYG